MNDFSVEFYTKPNGEKPAKDFILNLDSKMKSKMFGLIELLEEYGNELREPYSKYLKDGIFEIRARVGNNISRVLYFFYYGNKIVLTNGFIKKSQTTPNNELKLAQKYKEDYLERSKNNE